MAQANEPGRSTPSSLPPVSRSPFDQIGPSACKILVVDDETGIRNAIADSLRQSGYDVWEASGGAAALEYLECQPFELVLTDLVMPEIDGLTLVKMATHRGHRA